jgi:ribosomal protein L28
MARVCAICGKSYLRANLVPRGIGRRVTKRTLIARQANLRSKRLEIDGTRVKVLICSSCLKRMKFDKRKAAEVAAAAVVSAETK